MKDLGPQDNLTAFTMSDFGRAYKGNASGGSDHAWGSNHLVLAGALANGKVHGRYPDVTFGGNEDSSNDPPWMPRSPPRNTSARSPGGTASALPTCPMCSPTGAPGTAADAGQSRCSGKSLDGTGQAWSTPASDQRFLLIFLRGGYDALNVVIPTYSDFYYEARPTIAIARPDPANTKAALPLDSQWSLHPALKDTIYPLWRDKQIAFIPFAGTDDLTRSHFETQDTLELGQPINGSRNYRSGFMSRLAEQLSAARPIAFTNLPPLTFDGAKPVPNVAVAAASEPPFDKRQAALIQQMYQNHSLETAVTEGFSVRDKAYSAFIGEMAAANRNAATSGGFELAARRVARMMKTDYNLAFLDVGGWDTHANQGNATGPLADRVKQLGRGLAALAEEMGPETWAKTTVVVVSEFGRTFRENGDRGTDHGHGSVYWVLGGSVKGGRIAGSQIQIARNTLNDNRDLKVLTDYRALSGGLFSRLYALDSTRLNTVFPTALPTNLALI